MKQYHSTVRYVYGAAVFAVLWQLCAVVIDLPIVPLPAAVFKNLLQIFMDKIAIHSIYSLWRIAAGVFLALLVGIPLGLYSGYFTKLDQYLSPIVYLTYPIPKIALLPVLMLLTGLGEISKILMIFLILVFQVIIAVRDSVKGIPKETYYPHYSLGASFVDIVRDVLIPAALPKLLTALRVAMATAISVLFFTETFGTTYGMGYFIMDAWMRVNYLEMYSGIAVLSNIGLILFVWIDLVEKKLCRWQ